jgi:hypothetical protein
MKRFPILLALALFICLFEASSLSAQTASVTAVYAPLVTDFQNSNPPPAQPPIYQPGLFGLPDGSLGMITQGSCLGFCTVNGNAGDALWRWRRSPGGSWSASGGGITPSMNQQTTSLGETIPAGAISNFTEPITNFDSSKACQFAFDPQNPPKGAFGYPSLVRMDNKLFMAFAKGNGDWWSGEIWWAVSGDDGANWSVYQNPIIYGYYHRWHRGSNPDPHGTAFCNEGIVGISLATTTDASGKVWFHVYASYAHPDAERNTSIDPPYSAIDFRFGYNPLHPFGFGTGTDLWYNGAYRPSSGKFVWSYDSGAPQIRNDGGLDEKLHPASVLASWAQNNFFGTAGVTTQMVNNQKFYLMMIDGWRSVGDPLHVVTSCDGTNWSSVQNVSTQAVTNAYPGKMLVNNSMWYGTLSNITSLWGFLSLSPDTANPFDGTRILPVKIDGVIPRC